MSSPPEKRPRAEVLSEVWRNTQATHSAAQSELLASPHPRLLVLDLDQTLWPFDAAHPRYSVPTKGRSSSADATTVEVECRGGTVAKPFAQAMGILAAIAAHQGECIATRCRKTTSSPSGPEEGGGEQGWRVGVASSNGSREVCVSLLTHLGLLRRHAPRAEVTTDVADPVHRWAAIDPALLEIHPGSKRPHLERLADISGVAFKDMLFFDDSRTNISTAERLGVVAQQVSPLQGLTWSDFARGVAKWRAQRSSGSMMAQWLKSAKLSSTKPNEAVEPEIEQEELTTSVDARSAQHDSKDQTSVDVIDLIDDDASPTQ